MHVRADARDNRGRILAAADDVFGRRGGAGSTAEVARQAGVGIATVFRHFPTKADLLEAVLAARLGRLCDDARRLAGNDDAGHALETAFSGIVHDAAGKLAIAEALADAGGGASGDADRAGGELRAAFGELVERARSAGAVRADVGPVDVYALLVGVSRASSAMGLEAAGRDHLVTVVFDGLRSPTP